MCQSLNIRRLSRIIVATFHCYRSQLEREVVPEVKNHHHYRNQHEGLRLKMKFNVALQTRVEVLLKQQAIVAVAAGKFFTGHSQLQQQGSRCYFVRGSGKYVGILT